MAAPANPVAPRAARRGGRAPRGFTLIEVLVVLALFSIGLVGVVAMQTRAIQVSVGAEDTSRAALLANELATTMWSQGSVTLPTATVEAWTTRVGSTANGGLPNGTGSVTVAGNVARITVTWRAPHEDASATRRYVTDVSVLP